MTIADGGLLGPTRTWLLHYDRRWLRPDLVGGLTAGAVVIPQAMAYATIADLSAQVGLYTCMVPMVVYALLGGSRTLSVSTTSTVAVLTASTLLAAGVAASAEDPARELATLTLLVGVILLGARVLKLGGLIDNISSATLTGIKTGVGLTVAAGQLPKLLGIPGDPEADNFIQEVRAVVEQLDEISWVTVGFSAATLVILVGLGRVAPTIPGPLVAVVGGIVLVAVASLDDNGVALIAPVTSGLPTPVAPSFDHVGPLLPGAFAIAIMCFLETASVARSVRRPDEPPTDNDHELAANALACVGGSFFRAMPSAGGFSQTAINQRAGARTQLSELVRALLAVLCALFLGGILSDLPQATLGAMMVVVAVIGLIKPSEFVRFWQLNRLEFWVAVVTAASGLLFGLLVAVAVGVALTLLLVLRELNHVGVTELQATPSLDDVRVADSGTEPVPGLLVLRFDGPLYTANVRRANRQVRMAAEAARPRVLVLDTSAVAMTSVTVIEQFSELGDLGVELWLAAMPPHLLATARRTERWDEMVHAGRLHLTSLAAVHAYRVRAT